jgi:hypothetical protein
VKSELFIVPALGCTLTDPTHMAGPINSEKIKTKKIQNSGDILKKIFVACFSNNFI